MQYITEYIKNLYVVKPKDDIYHRIKILTSNKKLFYFIRPKIYNIIVKALEEELNEKIIIDKSDYGFNFDEWILEIYNGDVNIIEKDIIDILSIIDNKIPDNDNICNYMFYDPRYYHYLITNMDKTLDYIDGLKKFYIKYADYHKIKTNLITILLEILDFYRLVEIYTNNPTFITMANKAHIAFRNKLYVPSANIITLNNIVECLDWNDVILVGSACQCLYYTYGEYNDIDLINKTNNLENCAMKHFDLISKKINKDYSITFKSEYKIIAKFIINNKELNIEVFNVNNIEQKISNFHLDPARMYYDGSFHMTCCCLNALRTKQICGAKYFTGKKSLLKILQNYSKKGYRISIPFPIALINTLKIKRVNVEYIY
jgi:hypothetical protein